MTRKSNWREKKLNCWKAFEMFERSREQKRQKSVKWRVKRRVIGVEIKSDCDIYKERLCSELKSRNFGRK